MGKLFGYHTLGVLLKSLSDSCFRADEQEKRGEKVTACGMSSDEIEAIKAISDKSKKGGKK